jgi:peptide-methionine (S)-S-oxide reductase
MKPPTNTRAQTPRPALGKMTALLLAGTFALIATYWAPLSATEKAVPLPAPSQEVLAALGTSTGATETAVFAGGCFWGIQAVFQHTQGVVQAVSGYAGGKPGDADYETVSRGTTGHAEAVQVTYDPRKVSYAQLLQIFFSVAHDPTQLNRQYPDTGTQYRSAIFYAGMRQKAATERYIAQIDSAKAFPAPVVTQVAPLTRFYPAEKYHQNYATLHPDAAYIARFDLPKVANLKTYLPSLYREQPALVAQ